MATYIIGDIQGCYEPLQRLLAHIAYNPQQDKLWFCGDLIARGPQSLECLLFIRNLGQSAVTVLGNHDLNFIASYYGYGRIKPSDKLHALEQSPELPELIHWLCQQPLIYSGSQQHILVHAGLAPEWTTDTAIEAAASVSKVLKNNPVQLLSTMYDNKPERWQDAVTEQERWRFTVNACTRMRFCRSNGALELKEKGPPQTTSAELQPWYEFWRNKPRPELFFGHWASLNGYSPVSGIHALDTGCVWGNKLTAYCLETQQRYTVMGLQ